MVLCDPINFFKIKKSWGCAHGLIVLNKGCILAWLLDAVCHLLCQKKLYFQNICIYPFYWSGSLLSNCQKIWLGRWTGIVAPHSFKIGCAPIITIIMWSIKKIDVFKLLLQNQILITIATNWLIGEFLTLKILDLISLSLGLYFFWEIAIFWIIVVTLLSYHTGLVRH